MSLVNYSIQYFDLYLDASHGVPALCQQKADQITTAVIEYLSTVTDIPENSWRITVFGTDPSVPRYEAMHSANKVGIEIYILMLMGFLEYEVPPVFKVSDVTLMRMHFCNRLLSGRFPI